jgi:hypothetical protein
MTNLYKIGDKVRAKIKKNHSEEYKEIETEILDINYEGQCLVKWDDGSNQSIDPNILCWWIAPNTGNAYYANEYGYIIELISEKLNNKQPVCKNIYSNGQDGMTGGPSGFKWL